MADTEKLTTMIDSLINKNEEEAQIAFHNYLGDKMKEELGQTSADQDLT